MGPQGQGIGPDRLLARWEIRAEWAARIGEPEDHADPGEGDAEAIQRRGQDDPEVEPGAQAVHVGEIVGQLAPDALQAGVGRLLDLGQPGDPGADGQPAAVVGEGALEPREEISPSRTLMSWGSSSRWVERSTRPTGVMRGSPGRLQVAPPGRSPS